MKTVSLSRIVKVICVVIFVLLIQIAFYEPGQSRDISYFVKEIRTWKYGIQYAVWDTAYHFNQMSFTKKSYNKDWKTLLKMFRLSHCNAVDIGANDGNNKLISPSAFSK